jgi:hypothetical protein
LGTESAAPPLGAGVAGVFAVVPDAGAVVELLLDEHPHAPSAARQRRSAITIESRLILVTLRIFP